MKLFTSALIAITVTVVLLCVISLTSNISNYFSRLADYQFMINQKEKLSQTQSIEPLSDRTITTTELFNLCNVLVDSEIYKTMQTCMTLHQKYDLIHLDTDIQIIGNKVFKSIKPEVFTNKDLIVTSDALMEYITERTILRLLNIATEYNNSLRMI